MKNVAIGLAVIILILLGTLLFYNPVKEPTIPGGSASSTSQNPVTSPDGHVSVTLPYANDVIASPVNIQGTVIDGGWFFEASFPVKVLDAAGKVLGQGTVQAQPSSDWTSTGTVPFTATISFTAPKTATGTIVLSKDNPSGAAQNAESFSIPVQFIPQAQTGESGIRGIVLLGPTCPVERIPPDPQCADKPYATTLTLTSVDGARFITQFNSNASGTFSVSAQPGQYAIKSAGTSVFPRCSSDGAVTVVAGSYTDVTVSCDTGIR